ncbi:MAG: aa3-type cytochrome c oxidase subunit IV [Rhizobiaceae bacterium]|nr:aa3-type cytochrome c oxidase subunit IV [Rhizobiaceae bacterium]
MADHKPAGPLETGAPMDYSEHERTYSAFLAMTKYGVIVCTALMVAMAFGFFVGGWFSGLIVFIAVTAMGALIL